MAEQSKKLDRALLLLKESERLITEEIDERKDESAMFFPGILAHFGEIEFIIKGLLWVKDES